MASSPPPSSPTGPDPKQATEAKLNGYLEGTLSTDERAEIESYLQSSPQHRQLLKELRATRELLRQLPRESAPPEIAEAFEQQMERSMLLDDLAIDAAPPGRRGPQKLLVAALVLLAAGLGTVIYLALPGPGSSTQRLTAMGPPADVTTSAESAQSARTFAAATAPPPPSTTLPAVAAAVASIDAPPPTTSTTLPTPMAPMAAAGFTAVAVAPPLDFAFARRMLDRQAVAPQQTALLTLVSDDPAAPQAVADYFRSSVILFQRTDTPATRPAAAEASIAATQPSTMPAAADAKQLSGDLGSELATSRGRVAGDADVATFTARNLALREATRLQTQLAATYGSAAVHFYAPAAWDGPPGSTTAPAVVAATTVMPDESLTVTVDQLVGPGVEKTNIVRVGPDGTIMLPMLMEPVPAAGLSFDDLQARIADRYRGANLISHPTVRVARGPAEAAQSTAGANAPASTDSLALAPAEGSPGPATEPAVLPAAASPTTAPSTPAPLVSALNPPAPGADGGQVMNLIVMVYRPTAGPATQRSSR